MYVPNDPMFSGRQVWVNTADPDPTAPRGSRSTKFTRHSQNLIFEPVISVARGMDVCKFCSCNSQLALSVVSSGSTLHVSFNQNARKSGPTNFVYDKRSPIIEGLDVG